MKDHNNHPKLKLQIRSKEHKETGEPDHQRRRNYVF